MADFKTKRSCAECICWDPKPNPDFYSAKPGFGLCRAGLPASWRETEPSEWCIAGFKQDSEKVAKRHRALEHQDIGTSHAAHAPKDAE
jgi:hypothetical protein